MQQLSDLKLNFINLIANMSNYDRLLMLYNGALAAAKEDNNGSTPGLDKFELGKIEIQEGTTKEDVFAEQGDKSITHAEVKHIVGDLEWHHTTDELLDFLR